MKPLGIISGTVILSDFDPFTDLKREVRDTPFGRAVVLRSDKIVFIPRHGLDPSRHILPHQVNHAANLHSLKDLGVTQVVGINSTGSLKREIKPGMLAVPKDYLMPTAGPTVIRSEPVHITPTLSKGMRRMLLEAARDCGIEVMDGGIYWQTTGPRLETRAEIAMMAHFADLVGMTMASEAIIAQELGLAYASLCTVDNFGHGLTDEPLSMEEIVRHAKRNASTVNRILNRLLEVYCQRDWS